MNKSDVDPVSRKIDKDHAREDDADAIWEMEEYLDERLHLRTAGEVDSATTRQVYLEERR